MAVVRKIRVTQKHINKGKKGSHDFCPVALALKDAGYLCAVSGKKITSRNAVYKPCKPWEYYPWDMRLHYPEYHNPRSVERFVKTFDSRNGKKKVKPFTFILKEE